MRKLRIQRVSPDRIDAIIEHRVPLGLFLTKEGSRWVAVDNRDGNAWTEDFRWKHHAIRWLRDEGSFVYAHFGN